MKYRHIGIAIGLLFVLFTGNTAFADNPIAAYKYLADPNGIVYKGRVYIYCSNDETNNDSYDLVEYTLLSSDDLVNWQDHGEVFNAPRDTTWATQAYAPTVVERDDKFYLYFPNSGSNIGVAIADAPWGPFVDPIEKPLITAETPGASGVEWLFDPGAFIDDDGRIYVAFGGGQSGQNARIIELNDDMISTKGSAVTVNAQNFFEAPFLHKRDNTYYFSYSTNWTGGSPRIDYLTSSSPMTGWTYQGTALPQPPDNNGNNNHASIFEFEGNWYIAYHNRVVSGGLDYKRTVNLDVITYSNNGNLVTATPSKAGVEQLKYGNPYERVEAETIDKQSGIETVTTGPGEVYVGFLENGDWFQFTGFDFGDGASEVTFQAAAEGSGGKIEIRVGSANGTLAGTCDVGTTGGWESFEPVTCPVTGLTGVQSVVFVISGSGGGSLLNIDAYQFKGDGGSTDTDTDTDTDTNMGTDIDTESSSDADTDADTDSDTDGDTDTDADGDTDTDADGDTDTDADGDADADADGDADADADGDADADADGDADADTDADSDADADADADSDADGDADGDADADADGDADSDADTDGGNDTMSGDEGGCGCAMVGGTSSNPMTTLFLFFDLNV